MENTNELKAEYLETAQAETENFNETLEEFREHNDSISPYGINLDTEWDADHLFSLCYYGKVFRGNQTVENMTSAELEGLAVALHYISEKIDAMAEDAKYMARCRDRAETAQAKADLM